MFCAAMALTAISTATIADEVADRAKDPNLWAAPGGDPELTRHSRLKDINTQTSATADDLVPVERHVCVAMKASRW